MKPQRRGGSEYIFAMKCELDKVLVELSPSKNWLVYSRVQNVRDRLAKMATKSSSLNEEELQNDTKDRTM